MGILSYNRAKSLSRLVNSIRAYTDLDATTVFISDDHSTDPGTLAYLASLSPAEFVVLQNTTQLGVAGNTNRLLRCLSRFDNMLLLNDDMEVIRQGWDSFYIREGADTNIKHFCYRQPGIYGAKRGDPVGTKLLRVMDKPHGAALAFDKHVLRKIGYFNEAFGLYGCEHVDWSRRAWLSGLQAQGFYDLRNSELYFRLHHEQSALRDRHGHLRAARALEAKITDIFVFPSDKTAVPTVNYVVPEQSRLNVLAQKFPGVGLVDTTVGLTVIGEPGNVYESRHAAYAYQKLSALGPGATYYTRDDRACIQK